MVELMGIPSFQYLLLLLLLLFPCLGARQDDYCNVSRCGQQGPSVRFPFRLVTKQPEHCGYPGFDLYCNHLNQSQTMLHLPDSIEVVVKEIDYTSQIINLYCQNSCFPSLIRNLSLSTSRFRYNMPFGLSNFTLFNCSARERNLIIVPCLSVGDYQVYAVYSNSYYNTELTSCVKMYDVLSAPDQIYYPSSDNELQLSWIEPNCRKCEAKGNICSWMNYNSTTPPQSQLQCLPKGSSKKPLVIGLVFGTIFLALVIIALYRICVSYKIKKDDQVKIKTFLEDYKALKPTRYSFADIKKITNQFKDKLGEGGYGTVFKGKLSNEIFVAVKVLNISIGKGEEFINEVGTMARIHHVNVVRLVGFCSDGIKRALVYEFLPNESLEKFIFARNLKNTFLGWDKLQEIALGIAKGIEYLHQGCDQQILHFDIKPHNILLDHKFNPKIADFGLAKLCSKEQSIVSMTAARGTMGYIAPEVFSRNFGNVSYKSDVYSFGMMLLEMVGGRKNIDVTVQNTSQTYFPEWIYNRLCQGEGLGIRIEEEEHDRIAKKLTIVGLWCIQWYPVDRPSMKTVVQMLEGKENTLTMPPNPFASTIQNKISTKPAKAFHRELEIISEAE